MRAIRRAFATRSYLSGLAGPPSDRNPIPALLDVKTERGFYGSATVMRSHSYCVAEDDEDVSCVAQWSPRTRILGEILSRRSLRYETEYSTADSRPTTVGVRKLKADVSMSLLDKVSNSGENIQIIAWRFYWPQASPILKLGSLASDPLILKEVLLDFFANRRIALPPRLRGDARALASFVSLRGRGQCIKRFKAPNELLAACSSRRRFPIESSCLCSLEALGTPDNGLILS